MIWGGVKLSDRRISTIKRADIAFLHSKISTSHPVTANRVLALISSVFGWAIKAGLWDERNPASSIPRNRERSRDRFLQGDEMPRFFRALAEERNETIRDYILISLFTGARQGNVLTMKWSHIDFTSRIWFIPETKNGTAHMVPLTMEALVILDRRRERATVWEEFVFAASSKPRHLVYPQSGWRRILKRANISGLRLHDLRSTCSWQAATGASLPIIGKTLNHKSPASTAIYARLSVEPVRKAVEAANAAILRAAGEQLSLVSAPNVS